MKAGRRPSGVGSKGLNASVCGCGRVSRRNVQRQVKAARSPEFPEELLANFGGVLLKGGDLNEIVAFVRIALKIVGSIEVPDAMVA